jgi:hypothetical protein
VVPIRQISPLRDTALSRSARNGAIRVQIVDSARHRCSTIFGHVAAVRPRISRPAARRRLSLGDCQDGVPISPIRWHGVSRPEHPMRGAEPGLGHCVRNRIRRRRKRWRIWRTFRLGQWQREYHGSDHGGGWPYRGCGCTPRRPVFGLRGLREPNDRQGRLLAHIESIRKSARSVSIGRGWRKRRRRDCPTRICDATRACSRSFYWRCIRLR